MRTLVDIEEPQIRELDRLAKREKRSRAALIRQAIADYVEKHGGGAVEDAFGLWGKRKTEWCADNPSEFTPEPWCCDEQDPP